MNRLAPDMLSEAELEIELDIAGVLLRELAQRGQLPYVNFRGGLFINRRDLPQWREARERIFR